MAIFADRIMNVMMVEGTVRLQFIATLGHKDGSGNPVNETVETIIMSEQGFLASCETLEKAKKEAETRRAAAR